MASGKYGIISPSFVDPKDLEILWTYQPDRQTDSSVLNKLDATQVLLTYNELGTTEEMGGLYRLKLPSNVFNQIGIYTLFLRPKRIKTQISDCGVIATLPDVKGIVLDGTRSDLAEIQTRLGSGGLSGYRVEYLDESGQIQKDAHTLVTWSNRCEAISQNIGNSTQKSIQYRFNEAGSLVFLTLTPSVSTNALASTKPFIGKPNQQIYLVNTYFDPLTIEVNLTRHDFDTLAHALYDDILENVQTGRITVFDTQGNIYKQTISGEIKDSEGNVPLYRFRQSTDQIDLSETLGNALNDANQV